MRHSVRKCCVEFHMSGSAANQLQRIGTHSNAGDAHHAATDDRSAINRQQSGHRRRREGATANQQQPSPEYYGGGFCLTRGAGRGTMTAVTGFCGT